MKTLILASVVALTAFAAPASADLLCADKGRFGWKITGPNYNSNTTDWQAKQALGQAIGDGVCQAGWSLVSTVDHRIVNGPANKVHLDSTSSVATVRGSSSTTVTNSAGLITAPWQGFAPQFLKGRRTAIGGSNDKWKLKKTDGDNHKYKLVKQGNHPWPKGSKHVFTTQDILDRDYKGGTATKGVFLQDKLRYNASKDTTTTVTNYDVETTRTYNVSSYRTFCPSVWTYAFVSPTGEVVATTKGKERPCTTRRTMSQRTVTVPSTVSETSVTVGSKYVTPNN